MRKPSFQVRSSRIQGRGAFATEPIRKGTRLIEYVGERISTSEADRRYEDNVRSAVLLFRVDDRLVVDAAVGGNEARYINHSCEPNCRPVIEDRRVFIEALRAILPGEELTYDYSLTRDELDDEQTEIDYACHCGAPTCRGTMLEVLPKHRKTAAKKRRAKSKKRTKSK
jgi:SET domain-containing protein